MTRRTRQSGRNINGILLLDKPAGISSNAALQRVKRIFQARKAGHTGSLDPLATGMLPICLGQATKISGFLLEADKSYHVLIQLGVTTTTGDAEGDIVQTRSVDVIGNKQIMSVLADFTGEIEQIPPMFSAVKLNGTPLYKLARQGIEVERKSRKVQIHELKLVNLSGELLEIEVRCSKGTYIRTLAEDIGAQLGCGGYVSTLRRRTVGNFETDRMMTLEMLESVARDGFQELDKHLFSMESALTHWPDVRLSADVAYFFQQGQAVFSPQAPSQGFVRIYTGENHFLGVGCILDDGRIAPKRLVNY